MKIMITENQFKRLLRGQTDCGGILSPKLNQALDFWRKWLSNPSTKNKTMSLYNINENKVNQIYDKYFRCLDEIRIEPIISVPEYYNRTYAWADKAPNKNIIYVNCSKVNDVDVDWVGIMIHEIQHLLGMIYPLSPPKNIRNVFTGGNEFKNNGNVPLISDVASDSISRVLGVDKGVADTIQSGWLKKLYELDVSKRKYYICDVSEKYSNIMAIRNLFNVVPGKQITVEMLRPYIMMEKRDVNVSLLLGCWAIRGFMDLNGLIYGINQLAVGDNKQVRRF